MESIREVKEALTARSQTKSLDELQSGGRTRVKVIRAEHIAAMIDEAVQRAVAESGLIPREEVDRLVEKSRTEFASVHAERQRESQELQDAQRELENAARRRDLLTQQVASLEEDVTNLDRELAAARARISELEGGAAPTGAAPAGAAGIGGAAAATPAATPPGAGPAMPADAGNALFAALDKLTESMTDRLEQMGRKMGISGAVEADAVKLDALLSDLGDQQIESNLETMEVKQRQTGGIAANLARLKKLKGGE